MKTSRFKQHETFASFMRPLTESEEEYLRTSLVTAGGADDPIKVWQGFIIDGYNRERICFEEGLRYPDAKDLSDQLETETDVTQWILRNQLGRRNNTENERMKLIGLYYNARKEQADLADGEREDIMSVIGEDVDKFVDEMDVKPAAPSKKAKKKNVAKEVAGEFGVSERTVKRAGKVATAYEDMTDAEKAEFDAGKTGLRETEKQAPKKQPKSKPRAKKVQEPQYAPGKSAATGIIEAGAKAFAVALKAFKDKAAPIIAGITEESPAPLRATANLIEKFGQKMMLDLDEMLDVYVCEACLGESLNCSECSLGFADADNRARQLRLIKDDETYVGKNRLHSKPAGEEAADEAEGPETASEPESEPELEEAGSAVDEDPMEAALRRHPTPEVQEEEEDEDEEDAEAGLHPRDDESDAERAEAEGKA